MCVWYKTLQTPMTERQTKRLKMSGESKEMPVLPTLASPIWSTVASFLELSERYSGLVRASKTLKMAGEAPLAWLPVVEIKSCDFPAKLLDSRVKKVVLGMAYDGDDDDTKTSRKKTDKLLETIMHSHSHVTKLQTASRFGHLIMFQLINCVFPHIQELELAWRPKHDVLVSVDLVKCIPNLVMLAATEIDCCVIENLTKITTLRGEIISGIRKELPRTVTDLSTHKLSPQIVYPAQLKRFRFEFTSEVFDHPDWFRDMTQSKVLMTLELPGRLVYAFVVPQTVTALIVGSLLISAIQHKALPHVSSLVTDDFGLDIVRECCPNLSTLKWNKTCKTELVTVFSKLEKLQDLDCVLHKLDDKDLAATKSTFKRITRLRVRIAEAGELVVRLP